VPARAPSINIFYQEEGSGDFLTRVWRSYEDGGLCGGKYTLHIVKRVGDSTCTATAYSEV
jgi:hypothetical protein